MSIKDLIDKLGRPSAASLGSLLIGGFVAGVIFGGGWMTAQEAATESVPVLFLFRWVGIPAE